MKKDKAELLKEYIKVTLQEESGGDAGGSYGYDYGYSYGGYGGGGNAMGSASELQKALVDPITDVFKVLSGKSKEILASVAYLATLALTTTLSILTLGFIRQNYDRIHSVYRNSMARFRSEYASVVSINNILKNNDFMFAAFMYSPGVFMLAKPLAKKFLESRMLLENDKEELVLRTSQLSRAQIDKFFDEILDSYAQLRRAATIQDLNLDTQTLRRAEKDLADIEDPSERVEAELTLIKTLQAKVLKQEVERLNREKEKTIKILQHQNISPKLIFDPKGIVAKYDSVINELVRMG